MSTRPLRTYAYPDGVVEITVTGAVTSPNQIDGQRFGISSVYAHVVDGPWRSTITRSLHRTLAACESARSAAEAMAAITGEGLG